MADNNNLEIRVTCETGRRPPRTTQPQPSHHPPSCLPPHTHSAIVSKIRREANQSKCPPVELPPHVMELLYKKGSHTKPCDSEESSIKSGGIVIRRDSMTMSGGIDAFRKRSANKDLCNLIDHDRQNTKSKGIDALTSRSTLRSIHQTDDQRRSSKGIDFLRSTATLQEDVNQTIDILQNKSKSIDGPVRSSRNAFQDQPLLCPVHNTLDVESPLSARRDSMRSLRSVRMDEYQNNPQLLLEPPTPTEVKVTGDNDDVESSSSGGGKSRSPSMWSKLSLSVKSEMRKKAATSPQECSCSKMRKDQVDGLCTHHRRNRKMSDNNRNLCTPSPAASPSSPTAGIPGSPMAGMPDFNVQHGYIKRLEFSSANNVTWTHAHQMTLENIRFELPCDLRLLEGMSPLAYLQQFSRVKPGYRDTYSRIFTSHRNPKTLLLDKKNIFPALSKVMQGQLSEENYKLLLTHVVLDNRFHRKDTDSCGQSVGSAVVSEDRNKAASGLTVREFIGLVAFCERKLWSVNISSAEPEKENNRRGQSHKLPLRPFLEELDFRNLRKKLEGLAVSRTLLKVLISL